MDWLIWGGAFVAALGLLVKSADWFVDSAEKIGSMLGVPQFVIGITVVALGTSLPELATSVAAALADETEFILGNAIGSNVANLGLILGITSLAFRSKRINRDMSQVDLPFFFISAFLLIIFAVSGDRVGLGEGFILLAAYGLYVSFLITQQLDDEGPGDKTRSIKPFLLLILSGVGIYLGAEYTLKSTIQLSRLMGFADTSILALSAVAIGTSLPELLVSIKAARIGALDMVVGNIIGSNIFNSLVVIGLPALFSPIQTPASVTASGVPFMIGATVLGYLVLLQRRVNRTIGALFLLLFSAFMLQLFGLL